MISEKQKKYLYSEENIKKLRENRKNQKDSPSKGKKIWEGKVHPKGMLGNHTEETKKRLSISTKKYLILNPDHMKNMRKNLVVPMRDTSIEVKIQDFLTSLHIEYFTHKYISEITHSYQCDILIPVQTGINQKIIIECDGCFYHACTICNLKEFSWTVERRELDKIRTRELIEKGFRVLRLKECEIKPMSIDNFQNKLQEVK